MKRLLTIGIILFAIMGGIAFYLYNKPTASNASKSTDIQIDAPSLFQDFTSDEKKANEKYLSKVCEVTGTISDIALDDAANPNITLSSSDEMDGILCNFEKGYMLPPLKTGDKITIKGECTGLMSDVVLDRCVLKK